MPSRSFICEGTWRIGSVDSTRIGNARLHTDQTKQARCIDLRPAVSPFPGNPLEAYKKPVWGKNHILVGGNSPIPNIIMKDDSGWVCIASQRELFGSYFLVYRTVWAVVRWQKTNRSTNLPGGIDAHSRCVNAFWMPRASAPSWKRITWLLR